MTTDEKVEVKLSTKEVFYKLRVLDVQQERRLLLIQKMIRVIHTQIAELKFQVAHIAPPPPSYTEDIAEHARLLRLGERSTSKDLDLEWDKDSNNFDFDVAETKPKSVNLLEVTVESEESAFRPGKNSLFCDTSRNDSRISCTELANLHSDYNLEFVLFSNKKLTIANFVLYANLDDEEVGMWAGAPENSSFFKNYNMVNLAMAKDEAIAYMARITTNSNKICTKEINASFHPEDGLGDDDRFNNSEVFSNISLGVVEAGRYGQFAATEETSNIGEVWHTTQEHFCLLDQNFSQSNINESGPQTTSHQIKESQSCPKAGSKILNNHGTSYNERTSSRSVDKKEINSSTPRSENGTGEICNVCHSLNCTDLICWIHTPNEDSALKPKSQTKGVNHPILS